MSEEYTSVRVANVSKEASEAIISSFFSFCGEIVSIDIRDSDNPDTNEVIIAFGTHDAAKMAEVLSNTAFLDNTIVIIPYLGEGQSDGAAGSSSDANGTAESNENVPQAESPKPAEEKTGENNNDDDDDDDGKDEAVTESTPSNNASEIVPEATPAEAPKENAGGDGNNNDNKEAKEEKDKQESEENANPDDGGVVHVNKLSLFLKDYFFYS